MSSSSNAPPPPPPGVGDVGANGSTMGLSKLKKGGGGAGGSGGVGSGATANRAGGAGVTANETNANGASSNALHELYPVNSIMELTISPTKEVVKGLIYCTDEISSSVVVMMTNKASQSTYDIRVVNADSIMDKKIVKDVP